MRSHACLFAQICSAAAGRGSPCTPFELAQVAVQVIYPEHPSDASRAPRLVTTRAFTTAPVFVSSSAGIRSSPRRLSYPSHGSARIAWPVFAPIDFYGPNRLVGGGRIPRPHQRRWIRPATIASTDAATSQGILWPPSILDDNGDMATNVRKSLVTVSQYATSTSTRTNLRTVCSTSQSSISLLYLTLLSLTLVIIAP